MFLISVNRLFPIALMKVGVRKFMTNSIAYKKSIVESVGGF